MIAQRTIGRYEPTSAVGPPAALTERLTRRQCQVAILVADGLSNAAIAAELGLQPQTVRLYVAQIARRLGIESDPDMDCRVRIVRVVILAWSEAA